VPLFYVVKKLLFLCSIPQEAGKASVIRLFALFCEKTGGEFSARAVIGDAFAAFPVAGAGVGAGACCGVDTSAHQKTSDQKVI
jgi:hypothetical protein